MQSSMNKIISLFGIGDKFFMSGKPTAVRRNITRYRLPDLDFY